MKTYSNLRLRSRLVVVFLNIAVAYGILFLVTNKPIPSTGLEGIWFFSAVSAWFFGLLSTPWFAPPRDALATAAGAFLVYVTLDLSVAPSVRSELEALQVFGISLCVLVIVVSTIAMMLHDKGGVSPTARSLFSIVQIVGRGEVLFSAAALISIVGSYPFNTTPMAWLTIAWVIFFLVRPFELVFSVVANFALETKSLKGFEYVGIVDRVDHPDIIRVKLNRTQTWNESQLHTISLPGGEQRYAIALFTQVQGSEVIGTGLCIGRVQDPLKIPDGAVCATHDQAKTAEFIEQLAGIGNAQLVGFVVERSSIAAIRFEVAKTSGLSEGDVVFTRIEGREVFYQLVDAETNEETFDRNPRGTHIVQAAQLGFYNPEVGFTKCPWLPAMNAPLFATIDLAFPESKLAPNEFEIGNVPSTNIPVVANIDEMIQYHTAILGVTGMGKTELALDVIRQALLVNAKVFCVDFTGEYKERLKDHKPIFPGPSVAESKALADKLFAVEAGQYGAGPEKKAVKEETEKLRASAEKQVSDFLVAADSNLAIFELPEITNSKATLRLTELYLSQLMGWARANRQARKILIVLEEAHTIVPETGGAGFDNDTSWVVGRIGQIALQGRKYGAGLLVVTQRTALVSKTILSQCNTFLTHNLIDQTSLQFLGSVYSSDYVRLIPNLRPRDFLAVGKAINAERPVLVRRPFDQAKFDASEALKKVPPVAEKPRGSGPIAKDLAANEGPKDIAQS